MMEQARQKQQQRRMRELGALWIGFLGGPIAWVLHLTLSYAVAEWGCASRFRFYTFMGINATCCVLLLVTLLALAGAGAAAWTAHRTESTWEARGERDPADSDARHPEIYMARSGVIATGTFLFVIVVESVPIFFFLQGC